MKKPSSHSSAQDLLFSERRKKRIRVRKTAILAVLLVLLLLSLLALKACLRREEETGESGIVQIRNAADKLAAAPLPDWVEVLLLNHGASRNGEKLEDVRNIVVHYVANPGTTARQNQNYFNLPETETSSHFIVGLEGEVIQCIPLDEKSAATNWRNVDTISIEVCHPDADGKFSASSYRRVVELCAWLCSESGLNENDVIRHYDVTGKMCPLYYVEHEDEWEKLKDEIKEELKEILYRNKEESSGEK